MSSENDQTLPPSTCAYERYDPATLLPLNEETYVRLQELGWSSKDFQTVCGKTGTAQKVDPKGGYEQGKYVVSFSGYMPADHPEFVALVVLDDAKTKTELNYGGTVAAPIFSRVAEKAARYLDLEPQEELSKTVAGQVASTGSPRH